MFYYKQAPGRALTLAGDKAGTARRRPIQRPSFVVTKRNFSKGMKDLPWVLLMSQILAQLPKLVSSCVRRMTAASFTQISGCVVFWVSPVSFCGREHAMFFFFFLKLGCIIKTQLLTEKPSVVLTNTPQSGRTAFR